MHRLLKSQILSLCSSFTAAALGLSATSDALAWDDSWQLSAGAGYTYAHAPGQHGANLSLSAEYFWNPGWGARLGSGVRILDPADVVLTVPVDLGLVYQIDVLSVIPSLDFGLHTDVRFDDGNALRFGPTAAFRLHYVLDFSRRLGAVVRWRWHLLGNGPEALSGSGVWTLDVLAEFVWSTW